MLAVEKTAYLTIDDGPAEDFIQKVEYLNGKGIKAVWFCLGKALESYSEVAISAIRDGHVIGNRSYDAADFSAISLNDVREQLERTDRIVEELYSSAGVSRPAKVFRFPYLQDETKEGHFAAIQRVLDQLGYRQPSFESIRHDTCSPVSLKKGLNVAFTLDTFDLGLAIARGEDKENRLSLSNEIIMLHDWISLEPFKALIEKLIAQGFYFQLPKEMNLSSMSV